jgi:hypothetical protein
MCLDQKVLLGILQPGSRQDLLWNSPHYQVFLDRQNPASCSFTVGSLACDDNGLRVAVLCRKVDLGVAFFTNLQDRRWVWDQQSSHSSTSEYRAGKERSVLPFYLQQDSAGFGQKEPKSRDEIVTFLMFAPPFPMMFLWNCLKIGTEIE